MIYSANIVSIYALIVAIYMGFDEIYLLGMDHTQICNKKDVVRFYKGNALHQVNDIEMKILENTDYKKYKFLNTYFLWSKYILLKKYTIGNSQVILNLSSESLLDVFSFKILRNIIYEKK